MLKTQITGIISFVCACFNVLWVFIALLSSKDLNMGVIVVFIIFFLSPSISVILYVYWTNFGKVKMNELEKIDYENEILKKHIEQKELEERLKNL